MTGLQHFNKEKNAIHSPMLNHHSLIPWGSFRGRQEEKWGSSRGRDHFGVDLGIILGLGIISGRDHFGSCTAPAVLSLVSYITRIQYVVGFHFLHLGPRVLLKRTVLSNPALTGHLPSLRFSLTQLR